MISFKVMQRAITAQLKNAVPGVKVYTNDIKKINQEALFITFLPVRQLPIDDLYATKVFRTIIQYFPNLQDKMQDRMYEVMDILNREFRTLKVEDRVITVQEETESTIVDNVLHFNVSFEFVDLIGSEEMNDPMETLDFNYELGG
ncbi:DUF6838 family protein [Dehalobacter sp. TeCB1]|uniref:phage tail terminator family protein n=1 Tax=Dehalobacter sp. TeCB1 TaxID=1843715 RepID=UPI00083A3C9B|nr:hypothetical protein [Dehalobacter sp. TeCB1]OCZ53795.1 hypothetical protein A7D23_07485 [Dehalobacter sp. TeCB1]